MRTKFYDVNGIEVFNEQSAVNGCKIVYDDNGNIVSRRWDITNEEETWVYDENNNLALYRNEKGDEEIWKYDKNERIIFYRNLSGDTTELSYFETGALKRKKITKYGDQNNYELTEYNEFGQIAIKYNFDGSIEKYNFGKLAYRKVLLPKGRSRKLHYNIKGKLVSEEYIYRNGSVTLIKYDDQNRKIYERRPSGKEMYFKYDAAGNLIFRGPYFSYYDHLIDGECWEYDETGNVISYKNFSKSTNEKIEESYNQNKPIFREYVNNGRKEYFLYDENGNTVFEKQIESRTYQTTIRKFDEDGNFLYQVIQSPHYFCKTDSDKRPIIKKVDQVTETFEYHANGNLKVHSIKTKTGITTEKYTELGNIYEIENSEEIKLFHENGQLKYHKNCLTNEILEYNEKGQLVKRIFPDGSDETFLYNENGLVTNHKYVDNTEDIFQYDKFGRLLYSKEPYKLLETRYDYSERHQALIETVNIETGYKTIRKVNRRGQSTYFKDETMNIEMFFEYDTDGKLIEKKDVYPDHVDEFRIDYIKGNSIQLVYIKDGSGQYIPYHSKNVYW